MISRAMLAILFAAGVLAAQPVTVTEPRLFSPAAGLAQGKIIVTASQPFTATDGVRVDIVPAVVYVLNGAFSVALEPTPAGIWYFAAWQLDDAKPRTERWSVPTSGPVSVGVVVARYFTWGNAPGFWGNNSLVW
jgi:hypothetical protein